MSITVMNRVSPPNTDHQTVVDAFHELYYSRASENTWQNTRWLGVSAFKCPLDMWIYQEIIHEQQPDVIVECGTCLGGSALFLASLCDLMGTGRVITIDIDPPDGKPEHSRITYLQGSSTSPAILTQLGNLIKKTDNVLVILDSDHHRDHVLNELRIYSPLIPVNGYIIVEDTNVNNHPVSPDFGPGPMEAVDTFLGENRDFVVDASREKYMMTFNPRGYLKRIR
ncbi:MAG: CmcI family methyltransferase [Calditrichota bacterium]